MSADTFYWIGDPRIVSISSWRADVAWYCSAEPEDLDLIEAYWGGPYGDENSVDLITQDGVPVGTLDFMITREDLAAIALSQVSQNVESPKEAAQATASDADTSIATGKKLRKRPRRRKSDRNQGELLLPIAGGGRPDRKLAISESDREKTKAG
jgi:hypothetical protein